MRRILFVFLITITFSYEYDLDHFNRAYSSVEENIQLSDMSLHSTEINFDRATNYVFIKAKMKVKSLENWESQKASQILYYQV